MEGEIIAAGFLVGILIGLTGVGGGSLMTPLLILFFNVPLAIAIGTDLLFAGITKSFATVFLHLKKMIDWRISGLLLAGSLPAAVVTLVLIKQLGIFHESNKALLTGILGIVLIVCAIVLMLHHTVLKHYLQKKHLVPAAVHPRRTVLAGIVIGVFVSLTSVGAGSLGLTALLFLYPYLPTKKVVATGIAHATLLSLFAGIGHLQMGHVDFQLLLTLLIGSLPGVLLGSKVGHFLPEKVMQSILICLLFGVGVRFVL